MPKEFKYIFNKWEDELLNIAHEAIECAIASAYLNQGGVEFLEKVAQRLAEFTSLGSRSIIRVVLSSRFANTKKERIQILNSLSDLPGVETRIYHGSEFQHRKNFIFKGKEQIKVLVGSVNITSAGLFRNLEMATLSVHENDDPNVDQLMTEFESMWTGSISVDKYLEDEGMVDCEPLFNIGDNVKYITTSQIGTINKVLEQSRGYAYRVLLEGKVKTIPERFLELYIDIEEDIIEQFISNNKGNFKDYGLFQTWFRLSRPLENNLYSYLGSRTLFNAHQFKPLLRFLSPLSDNRLFIADEVGVGKTIETGIIVTEMIARERLDNKTPILIICPNSLGPKWAKEMRIRFQLDFHIHDGKTLKYTLATILKEGRFPSKYTYSIVSLQLLRMANNLNILKEIDSQKETILFGCVIIDEAHHMRNTGTESHDLGNVLSGLTEMMLMLSATPLNLKNEDLFNQMHILNPILFPNLTTFEALHSPVVILNKIRRELSINNMSSISKIDNLVNELKTVPLGEVIMSHPNIIDFSNRLNQGTLFSTEELIRFERLFVSLSPLFSSFTRTRKREALEHQVYRDALGVPIKLTNRELQLYYDVISAIEEHYLDKGGDPGSLAFITNMHRRMLSSCLPAMREYLKWCVSEEQIQYGNRITGDNEDDFELPSTPISTELKTEFKRLLAEAENIENIDSKYRQFSTIIKKILSNPETPQIIVFSFFVRTLEYLKKRLEQDGYSVGMIHGGIPVKSYCDKEDRYSIMEDFKNGKYSILLSSEVGGEGLDFQYCHSIVNYDLPYNPMRVEQRIGRIDRFGQIADKIIVASLFIEGTVDEEIYERLYRRIKLVEDGIGALEPILGNEIADLQNLIMIGHLTKEQMEEKTTRLEEAIESAKQQMEEFEKHRAELLSDDYLAEPLNSITNNNFIRPEDAIELTKHFINKQSDCKFTMNKDGLGEIQLSESTIVQLKIFLKKPKNEHGYGILNPLFNANIGVRVVFNGAIADSNPDYLFLSPTGYWTRFITYQLENNQEIYHTFCFGAKTNLINLQIGEYLTCLFEVRIEGLKSEIEFFGVPLRIDDFSIVEVDYENFTRILCNSDCYSVESNIDDLDIEYLVDTVKDHLSNYLEIRGKKMEEENQYKVDSRIAALSRATEVRINNLEGSIEKHIEQRQLDGKEPSEKYIRLTQARIENEKNRVNKKIEELQHQKILSIDYTLVGIVLLKVEQ